MRCSCCYAPDILEMLQADLGMRFLSPFGYARFFFVQICPFFCEQNGGEPIHRTRKSPDLEVKYEMCCVCVFSPHLFWTSNSLEVPAGVTQNFASTFLQRCVSLFFSREGFSRSFPSSTVKSNLCTNDLIVLHSLGIFFLFFFLF